MPEPPKRPRRPVQVPKPPPKPRQVDIGLAKTEAPPTTREPLVEERRPDAQAAGAVLGSFTIQRSIASGDIYHAVHTATGRDVAIKIIDRNTVASFAPKLTDRFAEETGAVASSIHPKVVAFSGMEALDSGHVLLVLGFTGDQTFQSAMSQEGAPEAIIDAVTRFLDTERFIAMQIGNFRVDKLLGIGGWGSVYAGHHTELDTRVAVKILKPVSDDEFPKAELRVRQEARVLGLLSSPHAHPHILGLIDYTQLGDNRIAMINPFIYGQTLGDHAKDQTFRTQTKNILTIIDQVLDALGHAHEHGVIHRDVKPDNIMVGERAGEPHAYLLDFGIAKIQQGAGTPSSSPSPMTMTGTILGTQGYMDPTYAKTQEASARSDLYSVGATLFKALTGETPYKDPRMALLGVHQPRTLREMGVTVSDDLEVFVRRLVDPDQTKRYANAKEARAALRELPEYTGRPAAARAAPAAIVPSTEAPTRAMERPVAPQPAAAQRTPHRPKRAGPARVARKPPSAWQRVRGVLTGVAVTAVITTGIVGVLHYLYPDAVNMDNARTTLRDVRMRIMGKHKPAEQPKQYIPPIPTVNHTREPKPRKSAELDQTRVKPAPAADAGTAAKVKPKPDAGTKKTRKSRRSREKPAEVEDVVAAEAAATQAYSNARAAVRAAEKADKDVSKLEARLEDLDRKMANADTAKKYEEVRGLSLEISDLVQTLPAIQKEPVVIEDGPKTLDKSSYRRAVKNQIKSDIRQVAQSMGIKGHMFVEVKVTSHGVATVDSLLFSDPSQAKPLQFDSSRFNGALRKRLTPKRLDAVPVTNTELVLEVSVK